MVSYIVTGGTGFLGRRVVAELLDRDAGAVIHVLVREASVAKLDELTAGWGATLHHVSSVAVAGDHRGHFFEDDFDLGQNLESPYHRTKFAAEKLVREARGLRWRVYRPAIIAGDSRTGEMDKIDGPYYFFPAIARLAGLPSELPLMLPDLGATNIVPVDYVATAMVALIRRPGRNRRTYHLVNPEPQPFAEIYAALARAAGAPSALGTLPGSGAALRAVSQLPGVPRLRDHLLGQSGIPPEVAPHVSFASHFVSDSTRAQLRGLTPPRFEEYAPALWEFWRAALDPDRARPGGDRLRGRIVLITGASSGIGLATAHAVARRGATVAMVARGTEELEAAAAEIRANGGAAQAYTCDITSEKEVELLVKQVLADHQHVDYVVNNAGRSIRRSVANSTDRMHDFERTMAVNYFGAVRLILALLPSMRERRSGHFVNISSITVQTKLPRFGAYVASKSALDAFSEVAAAENADAGITFTSVRMPLVRTPMIAPTDAYRSFPAHSPEQAAAIVVRALTDRPARIDTPIGTVAQVLDTVMPSVKKAILNRSYRMDQDSAAARGVSRTGEHDRPDAAKRSGGLLLALAPVIQPFMGMPGPLTRITNRIPGLHW